MSEDNFKNSFKKFLIINKKAKFPISMFNVAMMRSMHYPEISMINILQSLTLFDSTKEFQSIFA